MLALARKNFRTTLAGLVGGLSLLAGGVGTGLGGHWWPVLAGAVVNVLANMVAHALAADARKENPS
jgi:hypothetical protein